MTSNKRLGKALAEMADPVIAEHSQRFFKTGKGEYGEGDRFLGIRVPVLRKLAKQHHGISLNEVNCLLKSPYHEERLCALLIMVNRYSEGDDREKDLIYQLYADNIKYVNNWDLVDISAPNIVGAHLFNRDKQPILNLCKSDSLWERRIAIMSTLYFIKHDQYTETLEISKTLLDDQEDLIHKAAGWMLREIGKRSLVTEKAFLKSHYKMMPRTMLRYAIEKFPEKERKKYLSGKI